MYVSSWRAAESESKMTELKITNILQMCSFMTAKFSETIEYKQ
jgi:hypothetical protein